mmetsp:Transcript_3445/g.12433  ORF Transcript_3445/g.12433 Transcript_3445/m.12433 type:complete len:111 (-) Transcript_3445:270-602(-)
MSVVGRIRHLPYIPLSLMKLPKAGDAELVFKTVPKTSKVEVKRYLEALYGLGIESVQTINYEGKKEYVRKNNMERINKFQRRADWKKVFVRLKEPVEAWQVPGPEYAKKS